MQPLPLSMIAPVGQASAARRADFRSASAIGLRKGVATVTWNPRPINDSPRSSPACAARNGREGLDLCGTHPGPIHLLLSDVVMPELGGRELAAGALRLRPGLRVMFMSGHHEDSALRDVVHPAAPFLEKPFTPSALVWKVREALDSRAA